MRRSQECPDCVRVSLLKTTQAFERKRGKESVRVVNRAIADTQSDAVVRVSPASVACGLGYRTAGLRRIAALMTCLWRQVSNLPDDADNLKTCRHYC